MCLKNKVDMPDIQPTPPAPPPAEVLTQTAPDKSKSAQASRARKRKIGTKEYRVGGSGNSLNIPG